MPFIPGNITSVISKIRRRNQRSFERIISVVCCRCGVSAKGENLRDGVRNHRFVVDNQDSRTISADMRQRRFAQGRLREFRVSFMIEYRDLCPYSCKSRSIQSWLPQIPNSYENPWDTEFFHSEPGSQPTKRRDFLHSVDFFYAIDTRYETLGIREIPLPHHTSERERKAGRGSIKNNHLPIRIQAVQRAQVPRAGKESISNCHAPY